MTQKMHDDETQYKKAKQLNSCSACLIKNICIPANITQLDAELLNELQFISILLGPKQYLYKQGERSDSLYLVRSGILKSTSCLANGEETIMEFYFPSDMFGWEAIDPTQLSTSIIAIDYSNICQISQPELASLMGKHEALSKQVLQLMAKRIYHDNLILLNSHAKQRVAKFLMYLCRIYSGNNQKQLSCKLEMTNRDIANYLRISPETLSREFKSMQTSGLINRSNGAIVIDNLFSLT